ncbi:hypothetical protein F442_00999 [Phytophthora nicotianae P10297]|uniref:Uncharacterized protein n=1 Tax=Phytophthora nicotianae P10297 TaxID=1317064 RepID=W3A6P5_PHYNI|nr:hypothetical protein F442_00999 [Phytophthora nicotianae P10297]
MTRENPPFTEHGYLDLAELLVPAGHNLLSYATSSSVPEVIEKILDSGVLGQNDKFAACAVGTLARRGRFTLMQRAARLWTPSSEYQFCWLNSWYDALREACESGKRFPNLSRLRWLMQHPLGCEACGNACDPFRLAAGADQVEVLEYLYSQGFRDGKGDAITDAVDLGQLNAVKWLLEHNAYPGGLQTYSLIGIAAGRGNLEILQYFHNLDPLSILEANRPKQGELGWWLRTEEAVNEAAKFATVEVLNWLRANGYNEKCSAEAMNHAANSGRLELLEWLHVTKARECTTNGAASNGHLEIVKFLHKYRPEGCTTNAMDLAAGEGCTVQAIQQSVARGHLRIVKFLAAHYAQFVDQVDPLTCEHNLEMIMFLQMQHPQVFSLENVANMLGRLEGGNTTVESVQVSNWLKEHYSSVE